MAPKSGNKSPTSSAVVAVAADEAEAEMAAAPSSSGGAMVESSLSANNTDDAVAKPSADGDEPTGERRTSTSAEELPPPTTNEPGTDPLLDLGHHSSVSSVSAAARKLSGLISREAILTAEADLAESGDVNIISPSTSEESGGTPSDVVEKAMTSTASAAADHLDNGGVGARSEEDADAWKGAFQAKRLQGKLAEMREIAEEEEMDDRNEPNRSDSYTIGREKNPNHRVAVQHSQQPARDEYHSDDDDDSSDSDDDSSSLLHRTFDSEEHRRTLLADAAVPSESTLGSALDLVRSMENRGGVHYSGGGGSLAATAPPALSDLSQFDPPPEATGNASTTKLSSSAFLAPLPIHTHSDPLDRTYNTSALDTENEDFAAQLVALKLALANARSKIDEQDLMLRYARRDCDRVEAAESESSELRERNAELGNGLDKLRRKSKFDDAELSALRNDNDALNGVNAKLTVKVREMESAELRQKKVLTHCMDEAQSSASQRTDLLEKLATRVVEVESSKSKLARIEKELNDSRKLCAELSDEKSKLESKLRQTSSIRDQLHDNVSQLMDERDELSREVRAANKSNIDLSRRLDVAEFQLQQARNGRARGGLGAGLGAGIGMWWQNASACLGQTVGIAPITNGSNGGAAVACGSREAGTGQSPRKQQRSRPGAARDGTSRTVMSRVDEEEEGEDGTEGLDNSLLERHGGDSSSSSSSSSSFLEKGGITGEGEDGQDEDEDEDEDEWGTLDLTQDISSTLSKNLSVAALLTTPAWESDMGDVGGGTATAAATAKAKEMEGDDPKLMRRKTMG